MNVNLSKYSFLFTIIHSMTSIHPILERMRFLCPSNSGLSYCAQCFLSALCSFFCPLRIVAAVAADSKETANLSLLLVSRGKASLPAMVRTTSVGSSYSLCMRSLSTFYSPRSCSAIMSNYRIVTLCSRLRISSQ